MVQDLSEFDAPVSKFVSRPQNAQEWEKYRLTEEQVADFDRQGYVAGIKVLDDEQIETLRSELSGLMKESHPAHSLFYEYHSNESTDSNTALFHALGAWRAEPGFHDILWNPAILMAMSQLPIWCTVTA